MGEQSSKKKGNKKGSFLSSFFLQENEREFLKGKKGKKGLSGENLLLLIVCVIKKSCTRNAKILIKVALVL